LDINILNTLRDDNVINVHSSSSYELSLFFSKTNSADSVGGGVALGESSSVCIDDDWPKANTVVKSIRSEGALVTTDCGHLEALMSHHLPPRANKSKKGKKVAHRGSSSGSALCRTSASYQAP
jgi:hypothetical protein